VSLPLHPQNGSISVDGFWLLAVPNSSDILPKCRLSELCQKDGALQVLQSKGVTLIPGAFQAEWDWSWMMVASPRRMDWKMDQCTNCNSHVVKCYD